MQYQAAHIRKPRRSAMEWIKKIMARLGMVEALFHTVSLT